jgi:hypothetical protein
VCDLALDGDLGRRRPPDPPCDGPVGRWPQGGNELAIGQQLGGTADQLGSPSDGQVKPGQLTKLGVMPGDPGVLVCGGAFVLSYRRIGLR